MPTYVSSGSPDVTYAVSVSMTRTSATTATVNVYCVTSLGHSSSSLKTGHRLVGSLWIPGVGEVQWEIKSSSAVWTGTTGHASSGAWSIAVGPTVTSLSGFQFAATNTYGNAGDLGWQAGFAVSVASGVSYTKTTHANLTISGEASTQAQAFVTLGSIPSNVGYTRVINWYKGTELISSVTVSSTSHSLSLTGLLPNTAYTVNAEVRIGSKTGTLITTKSVTVTTPQETGELVLMPKATYITATVSDMFDTPNYARTLEFYIKEDEDSEYSLFSTVEEQGMTAQTNLMGLISNARYDVQVLIKNGTTTLRTLVASIETVADTSLIPTADIELITQQLGTRLCTVTWITEKSVAGTTYTIEAKADDEAEWTTLTTMDEIQSPIVVTAHEGNADISFRISSVNESVAEGIVNYSDELIFYVRDDFVWDSEKVAGAPMVITANEWNRLREYAISRNTDMGNTVEIPLVRRGDAIAASTYNIMKNAISQVTPIGIADKHRGDAITAADIDQLRVAINTVAA